MIPNPYAVAILIPLRICAYSIIILAYPMESWRIAKGIVRWLLTAIIMIVIAEVLARTF